MIAPVSIRDAFEIFEDPRNLARITPPWLDFQIVTPEPVIMARNAIFDYRFLWHGLRLHWTTEITEYEPPFFFVDEMRKGPYVQWKHRHTFHPGEEGTIVTDEVHYTLPFGVLGDLVHRLTVATQLKDIFRYRQMSLNEILCGGKARWTDPVVLAETAATTVT
jgi:ligand-binding SRPBCC domain-containing protein